MEIMFKYFLISVIKSTEHRNVIVFEFNNLGSYSSILLFHTTKITSKSTPPVCLEVQLQFLTIVSFMVSSSSSGLTSAALSTTATVGKMCLNGIISIA